MASPVSTPTPALTVNIPVSTSESTPAHKPDPSRVRTIAKQASTCTDHSQSYQSTQSPPTPRSTRRRSRPSGPSSSSHRLYSQNPFQDEETTGSLVTQGFNKFSEWVTKKIVPGSGNTGASASTGAADHATSTLTAGGSGPSVILSPPTAATTRDGPSRTPEAWVVGSSQGLPDHESSSVPRYIPRSGLMGPPTSPHMTTMMTNSGLHPDPILGQQKPSSRRPHRLASSILPSSASTSSSSTSTSLVDDTPGLAPSPSPHDDNVTPSFNTSAISSTSRADFNPQHRPSSIRTNTNITTSGRGARQKFISFSSRIGSVPAAPVPTSATASGQTISNEDYSSESYHRPRRSSITPSFSLHTHSSPQHPSLSHSPSIHSLSNGNHGRPYLSHSTSHRASQQSLTSPAPPDSPGYGSGGAPLEFSYSFQPGFQTHMDDFKSVKGVQRNRSLAATKLIRKLGAEQKDNMSYWMPDETAQNVSSLSRSDSRAPSRRCHS